MNDKTEHLQNISDEEWIKMGLDRDLLFGPADKAAMKKCFRNMVIFGRHEYRNQSHVTMKQMVDWLRVLEKKEQTGLQELEKLYTSNVIPLEIYLKIKPAVKEWWRPYELTHPQTYYCKHKHDPTKSFEHTCDGEHAILDFIMSKGDGVTHGSADDGDLGNWLIFEHIIG